MTVVLNDGHFPLLGTVLTPAIDCQLNGAGDTLGLARFVGRGWMSYKVVYHDGESIDLLTPGCAGRLSLENGRLLIEGDSPVCIRHGTFTK